MFIVPFSVSLSNFVFILFFWLRKLFFNSFLVGKVKIKKERFVFFFFSFELNCMGKS